ncbi:MULTISPECIES: 50S ribosomal protein L1 [Coprobacillaceae]|uniref:50S ribosomal protein L1 n=1 Tax=Coprobacillaceae TaxID=2810280 RepID=UPI000E555EA9|nr:MULTISPECIES: 50S ribosomal protein L1 [Coprobacillaceae]RHM60991.1 50S ribosomal protein L1 [Coprobacillus sp. AF33-1AC]RHS94878.1 50S ribosomal protein L1 [Erysipelatoclostridium sp. AM42-17]
MAKKSKRYTEAAAQIEAGKAYSVEEAVELVKKTSTVKFDASVDVAFKLGLDVRQADQQLRGAVVLPHGTGKTKKVLVVTQGEKAKEAQEAGADVVGGKEILEDIKKGWLDFEVMIATPDMMAELGKLGRILGPKGLMPNPKTGTVTMDVAKAVKETKAGKVTYRTDKEGNVHLPIGRVSFDNDKLVENFNTIYDLIVKLKPSTAKGVYMKNVVISSTMGPAIKVQAAVAK